MESVNPLIYLVVLEGLEDVLDALLGIVRSEDVDDAEEIELVAGSVICQTRPQPALIPIKIGQLFPRFVIRSCDFIKF